MLGNDAVFQLLDQEYKRQLEGLELIASENFVSDAVMAASGSVATNKYAEGLPGKRYYGGCEFVDEIEVLAIERLKSLFGATWANVQPHSGSQANAAVMQALLNPGDTIMGFDLSHGGHLTHGASVNFSGKLYKTAFYQLRQDGKLYMEDVRAQALKHKPKMLIVGGSAYSFDWNYAAFREIADEIGAYLLADIAHPAGLIAAKLLNNPVPHCHVVTSTTHKTLRGPRGGIIMLGEDLRNWSGRTNAKGELRKLSSLLDSAVFPGNQGGPLMHQIAAKAVAFAEAQLQQFTQYAQQVIDNAQLLASHLTQLGYNIVGGGTQNHLLLIDLRKQAITGKQAENALLRSGITVNKNMVPFDTQSPFVTSGIRIGTAAITTRGLKTHDMEKVANMLHASLQHHEQEAVLDEIARDVRNMMAHLPLHNSTTSQVL